MSWTKVQEVALDGTEERIWRHISPRIASKRRRRLYAVVSGLLVLGIGASAGGVAYASLLNDKSDSVPAIYPVGGNGPFQTLSEDAYLDRFSKLQVGLNSLGVQWASEFRPASSEIVIWLSVETDEVQRSQVADMLEDAYPDVKIIVELVRFVPSTGDELF